MRAAAANRREFFTQSPSWWFVHTHFGKADFSAKANFSYSKFNAGAGFGYSIFRAKVDFGYTVFNHASSFRHALFQDSVSFLADGDERLSDDGTRINGRVLGKNPSLDFQDARIEKPGRISFHTVALRPNWFVNVDPRNFIFTDVSWEWNIITIKAEIESLTKKQVSSPYPLLAIECRQLGENAEANNRYEEASRFRYWAMELARRTKWKRWSFWKTDWLHMMYWAVSGYGERILRALGVLAAVWIVFVLLYTRVGFAHEPPKASNEVASPATAASMTIEDKTGEPLEFTRSLTYSLAVMSFQKPEPKPLTGTAQTLVLLETILGPVQAALLALAIRRKFMR